MESKQIQISIIGAGNMGGAIAQSIASSQNQKLAFKLSVSDINTAILSALKTNKPSISTSTSNLESIQDSDIIILAVKPWLVEQIAEEISGKIDYEKQIIVSIAAGIDLNTMAAFFSPKAKLFRIIPNTAIEVNQAVSIVSSKGTSKKDEQLIHEIFSGFGMVVNVPETQLNAYMSLASCGIAYAFRYIRAAMEGGIEMGIPAAMAKDVVLQTLKGAVELMETNNSHPEVEIDKVTTPGGITIQGLNEMEAQGFTNAVIKGLKASHIK